MSLCCVDRKRFLIMYNICYQCVIVGSHCFSCFQNRDFVFDETNVFCGKPYPASLLFALAQV